MVNQQKINDLRHQANLLDLEAMVAEEHAKTCREQAAELREKADLAELPDGSARLLAWARTSGAEAHRGSF